MVADALLDSFPVTQYDASVAEVLEEIREYQKLDADWDSEGACPVSLEAGRLAAWLVQMVALSARLQGAPWEPPVVGPNADGGINLEWDGKSRHVLVMIRPGDQPHVECILDEGVSPPRRQIVSPWVAIDLALWAISTKQ
jgi:hypothetical protein